MAGNAVKGLGEIALRVNDLDRMPEFYAEVIGLALMKRFENSAFFKVADGIEGHTQILALFNRSGESGFVGLDSEKTTVDHLAFSISLSDYEGEKSRLEMLGLQVNTAEHNWVHWRSLYVDDPEGNLVELVCYDEAT